MWVRVYWKTFTLDTLNEVQRGRDLRKEEKRKCNRKIVHKAIICKITLLEKFSWLYVRICFETASHWMVVWVSTSEIQEIKSYKEVTQKMLRSCTEDTLR